MEIKLSFCTRNLFDKIYETLSSTRDERHLKNALSWFIIELVQNKPDVVGYFSLRDLDNSVLYFYEE